MDAIRSLDRAVAAQTVGTQIVCDLCSLKQVDGDQWLFAIEAKGDPAAPRIRYAFTAVDLDAACSKVVSLFRDYPECRSFLQAVEVLVGPVPALQLPVKHGLRGSDSLRWVLIGWGVAIFAVLGFIAWAA